MKEQLLKELEHLLEQVPDKYDDFVEGMKIIMKKQDEEDIESVVYYIKGNPESKSDDILEYLEKLGI